MTYDAEIGVVGAGPAGARAAELLARAGAEVLLMDPLAPWEKPCGGGLTASAGDDESHVHRIPAAKPVSGCIGPVTRHDITNETR